MVIGCVDDISLESHNFDQFRVALRILRDFVGDFALVLSDLKCSLWGSDSASLREISAQHGFVVQDAIKALGAEWSLTRARAQHTKELKRVGEAKTKLKRIQILPIHPCFAVTAIRVWSLSGLDYALPRTPLLLPLKTLDVQGRCPPLFRPWTLLRPTFVHEYKMHA